MRHILRSGNQGSVVIHLQELLNKHLRPCPHLKVDGIFGPHTETAVLRYQELAGLVRDGIVGPHSWTALENGTGNVLTEQPPNLPLSLNVPWMAVAAREIGQREIPSVPSNPRILQYHATTSLHATVDEVAWCSAFVNWCLKQVGITGTNSAAASSWLHWGRASVPLPGSVSVVQKRTGEKHVAFWVSQGSDHYTLLGGNQSHQVKMSNFPKSSYVILGHRWPA